MIGEIEHASSGALRVARRKMLMSSELARQAARRLEIDKYGDRSLSNGVWDNVTSSTATGCEAVKLIEKELDEREEEYKARPSVREQVR